MPQRTLFPVRNWVWIIPDREVQSPGGILMPDTAFDALKATSGRVAAVGDGAYSNETGLKVRDPFCKVGDHVLFFLYQANVITHDNEEYVVVEDTHIMAWTDKSERFRSEKSEQPAPGLATPALAG